MSASDPARERLYNLLPSIYRQRDAAPPAAQAFSPGSLSAAGSPQSPEPLRALMGVMDEVFQQLEADIGGLYDDWFIETCAEWVVPYIGDLLGVTGLNPGSPDTFSLRSTIANTLAYRRRKGTVPVMEQLARDVTGWEARAVEFFELVSTTQHYNHPRPQAVGPVEVRAAGKLELLDSPFDTLPHTANIRHIDNGRGKHNLPNLGLFLWRLQNYYVNRAAARPVKNKPGCYTFNPFGFDQPLFNRPRTESELTSLAGELNVPGVLRRRPLFDELNGLRQALVDGAAADESGSDRYFDPQEPAFQIFLDRAAQPAAFNSLLVCDLSSWDLPPDSVILTKADGATVTLPIDAAIDPQLGRLALPATSTVTAVEASYAYGFSGDLGGGPYNRLETLSSHLSSPVAWQASVSQRHAPVPGVIFSKISDAVKAWNLQPPGTIGAIAIMDSGDYPEDLIGSASIQIPAGSRLILAAANWPEVDDPLTPGLKTRLPGYLEPEDLRPHLVGKLSVQGSAPAASANAGELVINGLLLEGELAVLVGNLGSLVLEHCCLAPGKSELTVKPSVQAGKQNSQLNISLVRSICPAIHLPGSVPGLSAAESIIDGRGKAFAILASGSHVEIESCTVYGELVARSLSGSNSLFNNLVTVSRRQKGCLRYSFTPPSSTTPRRYRCQPDLALEKAAPIDHPQVLARVRPAFSSPNFGDPDYAQLSAGAPEELYRGAEDGAEMGAWRHLLQPQREDNLRQSLGEYLPFGLEAGVFFVTGRF